ncbi:DotU family type IV/VI secretion system protein [Pseudomonas sp. DY-1]|uniref:type VI secretion system protein TssL, short form n=1 Tax=Pseudomonas sp. DY-1 TaxID=1755504 RepID=UPI000EA9D7DD|nr:type VI secretion system protein TssL, short form [Pseudomonas sp. DY-1]AYF86232.1 DotU family type IV/VI secretion system protein [Pseudomonas sp. DY-1]
MSRNDDKQTQPMTDIDALLQDSYLLVVELREGASARNGRDLWKHCSSQIEHVRQRLEDAGMSEKSINHISYAHCALLDETVLRFASEDARADWAGEPLQAKFFNRHQAGEFLYEDMREVLRESAPDIQVLKVFQRVLMLGFKGRYLNLDHPEREQFLAELNARVAPLAIPHSLTTHLGRAGGFHAHRWLRSPLLQTLAVMLLLLGTWWGLNRLLGRVVSSLLPGQV